MTEIRVVVLLDCQPGEVLSAHHVHDDVLAHVRGQRWPHAGHVLRTMSSIETPQDNSGMSKHEVDRMLDGRIWMSPYIERDGTITAGGSEGLTAEEEPEEPVTDVAPAAPDRLSHG